MMALALHSRWMGVDVAVVHATGGASVNRSILQVMADVFGAEVRRLNLPNAAALGAALRALHADRLDAGSPLSWDDLVDGVESEAAPAPIQPIPEHRVLYRDLLVRYAQFERAECAPPGDIGGH
jgi:xylulokinase